MPERLLKVRQNHYLSALLCALVLRIVLFRAVVAGAKKGYRVFLRLRGLARFGDRLVRRYGTPQMARIVSRACGGVFLLIALSLLMGVGVDGQASNPLSWVMTHWGPTVTSMAAAVWSSIHTVKIAYHKARGCKPQGSAVQRELAQQAFKGLSMVLVVFPLTSILSISCADWFSGHWQHPSPIFYTTAMTLAALVFNTPIGLFSVWVHTPCIQSTDLAENIKRLYASGPPDDPDDLKKAIIAAQELLHRLEDSASLTS